MARSPRDHGTSSGPNKKQTRHRPKSKKSKTAKAKAQRKRAKRRQAHRDPSDVADADVRYVQPYQATKPYTCPGCQQVIKPGTGHMVAVPPDDPDLRRHWHRGCWNNR